MVPKIARVIPAAPSKFPLRADLGFPIIFNPMINVTDPIKYDNSSNALFIIL